MKKLLVLLGLLFATPSLAVDNTVIVTPGTGVTMRSKDIGAGVQSMFHILGDTAGNAIYGTAGTANANILSVQGIASMTPFLTNPGTAANWGIGASGSAHPANAVLNGLSDGTNLQRWLAAIALADGVNGNNTGAMAPWLWNGTTYDRARGDTTNGMWANIKTSVLPTGAATAANQATEISSLATIATNSALPLPAQSVRTVNIGEVDVDFSRMASAAINVSTATTTQIVAISGSTAIYITSYDVVAGGTGNITFQYGTGTNCGTGTTSLTGAYPLTAQAGIAKGSGVGTVLKVPAGNALCVLTSAAVQMSGSVSYQQF